MSADHAGWPWSALGLNSNATLREVKSAYARQLKTIDHNDPAQFQPLQEAFNAAKARAKPAAPKPPSMAQLVQRDDAFTRPATPQGQTAPPDAAPKPAPETPDEKRAAPVATPPEPAGPEPAAPLPAEALQNPPAQPSSKPAPPPRPKPWGTNTEDLDSLLQTNPYAAETAFNKKLDAALHWPWHTDALSALLDREIMFDPEIKRRVERRIFNSIAENITDYSTTIAPQTATLLETHFQWVSDGVGFHRRFGRSLDFQRVVNCVSGAVPSKGTSRFTMEKRPWLKLKIGLLVVTWLILLPLFGTELSWDDAVTMFVITLTLAAIIRAGLIFLTVALFLIPGAKKSLTWLGNRVAPDFTADLTRSNDMRVMVYWVITAVLLVALFALT